LLLHLLGGHKEQKPHRPRPPPHLLKATAFHRKTTSTPVPMEETRATVKPTKQTDDTQQDQNNQSRPGKLPGGKQEKRPSWAVLRSLFACNHHNSGGGTWRCRGIGCSGSLCNSKESSRVLEGPEAPSPRAQKKWAGDGERRGAAAAAGPVKPLPPPVDEFGAAVSSSSSSLSSSSSTINASSFSCSSSSSLGGSFRGLHLRRLSGCYECQAVADPIAGLTRDPTLRTISPCPDCGEIFLKPENLELHQAVKHAVLELGPEDSSRNVVEIIFQSSWLKKGGPVCKIDRVLKVNNTQKKISSFESYRNSVKSKASELPKKHPRCVADGNELLRFHCTSFSCSVGSDGGTSLCQSAPHCDLCGIIKDGFKADALGRIPTMATSGRAHDTARVPSGEERRGMLVCRVIAGRLKKGEEEDASSPSEEYDSVAGLASVYANSDELAVFNPDAILPCFVVIYGGF
ncbi:hypothetical protein Taro_049973, partial [Colocasia esculenta]|nr:hypothetical protein [Colocasia esculenta]